MKYYSDFLVMSALDRDRLVVGCSGDSSPASDSDEGSSSMDEESMGRRRCRKGPRYRSREMPEGITAAGEIQLRS